MPVGSRVPSLEITNPGLGVQIDLTIIDNSLRGHGGASQGNELQRHALHYDLKARIALNKELLIRSCRTSEHIMTTHVCSVKRCKSCSS